MPKYNVPVQVVFDCNVEVVAENKMEARKLVADNFWLLSSTTSKNYGTEITNWEADMLPSGMLFKRITLK